MGLLFQACAVILILSDLLDLHQLVQSLEVSVNVTIVNFDNEWIQMTWAALENFPGKNVTFLYQYNKDPWKQCPSYLLDQGYNDGCLFKTEKQSLAISIKDKNGSEELFHKKLQTDFFIKPSPPENVNFLWKDDRVTVTCSKPKTLKRCLKLEFQYRSKFDMEWQSRKSPCCSLEDQGFDPEKCYSFRVRLERLYPTCNVVHYASEWGAVTFWSNGKMLGSCADDIKRLSDAIILLIFFLVIFLIIFILLIFLCKWQRFQKSIMPVIPDPKYIFTDLFTDHNGNLQEWFDKTENAMVQAKMECEEQECIIEEERVQEKKKDVKGEAKQRLCELPNMHERDYLNSVQNTCLPPTSSDMVSLESFKFLMNEDMYVML
ncbi:PREDICTED: cytokine receptor-like factor 2 [Crocodylus porosus]|uniref:cytokine receptor-like factor 2 n=1 Tax=Crocodylus porosus TaxID=8502 RepID=UPI00093D5D81|nr:PREDICTED: cytokine receptor-like factor 2 [Crocodylus porosus]